MKLYKAVLIVTIAGWAITTPISATDIRPEVLEQINQNQEVSVIITLNIPMATDFSSRAGQTFLSQSQEDLLTAIVPAGFTTAYRYDALPLLSGKANRKALEILSNRLDVQAVELDLPIYGSLCQSVPLVQADYVQNILSYTGTGITVGILDTGIDTDHLNFAGGRIVGQQHFLDQGTNVGAGAEDDNGHGTNVAGVVGGAVAIGCKGMAPSCTFVAVKVLDFNSSGWVSDWIAGLNWIISNNGTLGVDVINASLGTFALYSGDCAGSQPSMSTAITTLRNMGILTFCSSGNQGKTDSMSAPACLGNAVAVGASFDSNLGREPDAGTWLSNFGGSWPACFNDPANAKQITCFSNRNSGLDLLAPGRPITSSYFGGGLATYTGTSESAPHCAGLAALMRQARPTLTPFEIIYVMQQTGDAILDAATALTFKHINAKSAVLAVTTDTDGDGTPDILDNCPTFVNKRGDMQGDHLITSSDVVRLLNCIYFGGPNCALCYADVNCNGMLDMLDAIDELNYAFLGIPLVCPVFP